MTRSIVRTFLAALCAAGAAHAGTVYVPLPGQSTVGAAPSEVQVSIVNTAAVGRQVSQVLINGDTDGTQRAGVTPTTTSVLAGRTAVVRPATTFVGLMELTGPADVRVSARLAPQGGAAGSGVELPVIDSRQVTTAGGKLSLQGLISAGSRTTDLVLVNLGKTASQCSVGLMRADGTAIGATSTVALKPLSQRYFGHVFNGLVDAAGVSDARATVSCTQDFYAFALLGDSSVGAVSVVRPAASGESTLAAPGTNPNPGGGCGSGGVVCFDATGIVHQATTAVPVGRVTFTIPQGTWGRFKMSLDVNVGNWYRNDPSGKHLIYWFVVDKNLDMPGMLYFRGPGNYQALVRHGIGLTHPQKIKLIDNKFQAEVGHTYTVVNDYDMAHGVFRVTITDKGTGQVKSTILDAPNVRSFTTSGAQRFIVDMGFPEGKVPDEVPAYGWVWSNLHIEATPFQ